MKDPLGTCTYNLLYQDLKRFSKNGEYFCKELVTVFQQRSELEINYAKGLQKLAGKLIKLDNAIEKSGKLVVTNWNEQLKMFNRLTKSAELQARVDENYFNMNMEGHQIRVKWENTLKTCYQEEDGRTIMGKERRRNALKIKLQRLEEWITKTKKDKEGLEKMSVVYSENTSHSSQKNLEETEQLLDEATLKLDLLEATHCKLNQTVTDLEGKPKPLHRFSDSITKFKDKDCEHSIVKLSRPVKIKKTPFRSRQSLRTSIMYKGPAKNGASRQDPAPSTRPGTASAQLSHYTEPQRTESNGALPHYENEDGEDLS
ncbi:hypothetical protein MHYP_G00066730 [Metynnis hypsauchen]